MIETQGLINKEIVVTSIERAIDDRLFLLEEGEILSPDRDLTEEIASLEKLRKRVRKNRELSSDELAMVAVVLLEIAAKLEVSISVSQRTKEVLVESASVISRHLQEKNESEDIDKSE